MTNSEAFRKAHALTRATVQMGDSYSATFALALRQVYAEASKSGPVTAYITGDTYEYRNRFKKDGYRWDADERAWCWDYDETVTEERALLHVRQIPGIRNRGEFQVEIRAAA